MDFSRNWYIARSGQVLLLVYDTGLSKERNLKLMCMCLLSLQVEQLLAGHEDSRGNVNYEEFVRTVMNG